MKKKVLFICSHNAARSQMAEGYLRARYGDRYEAFSAGTEPEPVHPMAIAGDTGDRGGYLRPAIKTAQRV